VATITILREIRTKFYLMNLNGTNWKMHAQTGKGIPTIHSEAGRSSVNWIHLHSSGYGPMVAVVNAVMNIWVLSSGKVLGQVISSYCLLMDASAHYRHLATAYSSLFHFSHPRLTIVLVQTCLAAEPFWFPKHLTVHHTNDNANSVHLNHDAYKNSHRAVCDHYNDNWLKLCRKINSISRGQAHKYTAW
jgi:hypothetical protein